MVDPPAQVVFVLHPSLWRLDARAARTFRQCRSTAFGPLPGGASIPSEKDFLIWQNPKYLSPSFLIKQMTFADAEYADTRKQTRKKLALTEMDRVVSWKGLIAMIEPHYPTGEGGGRPLIC